MLAGKAGGGKSTIARKIQEISPKYRIKSQASILKDFFSEIKGTVFNKTVSHREEITHLADYFKGNFPDYLLKYPEQEKRLSKLVDNLGDNPFLFTNVFFPFYLLEHCSLMNHKNIIIDDFRYPYEAEFFKLVSDNFDCFWISISEDLRKERLRGKYGDDSVDTDGISSENGLQNYPLKTVFPEDPPLLEYFLDQFREKK